MGIRDPRIEKLSLAMVNQHAEAIVPFRSMVESKWLSLVVAKNRTDCESYFLLYKMWFSVDLQCFPWYWSNPSLQACLDLVVLKQTAGYA